MLQPSWLCFGAFLAISLAACGTRSAVDLGPALEVSPTAVDFGAVPLGVAAEIELTVRNRGGRLLERLDVRPGASWDRDLDVRLRTARLEPGEATTVRLVYTPSRPQAHAAVLRVGGPGLPSIEVPIAARGVASVVELEDALLDFGAVRVGRSEVRAVVLSNPGPRPATVRLASGAVRAAACTRGSDTTWCVETPQDGAWEVPAAGTATLQVRFSPQSLGDHNGTLALSLCEGEGECVLRANLRGEGVGALLGCAPASVELGFVAAGQCRDRVVVCEAASNETVEVLGWRLGASSSAWQVTPSAARRLSPNEQLLLELRYCAADGRAASDTLTVEIAAPAPDDIIAIPLSATSAEGAGRLCPLPATIDLGAIAVQSPAPLIVPLQNCGAGPLTIVAATAEGALGADVEITEPRSPASLQPGEVVDYRLRFGAEQAGPLAALLRFESTDPALPLAEVQLLATGVVAPPCRFSFSPEARDLGVLEVGRVRRSTLTLRNTGGGECVARALPTTGDARARLEPPVQRGLRVQPGDALPIHLEVVAERPGAVTATIELHVSDPADPIHRLQLFVEVVPRAPLLAPSPVDFGPVPPGCAASTRAVWLHNTSDAPFTVQSVGLEGTSDPGLSVAALQLPSVIPPRDSLLLEVSLAAGSQERRVSGQLEVRGVHAARPILLTASLAAEVTSRGRETVVLPEVREADVLFVVDDSGGPEVRARQMAASAAAFLRDARARGIDYRVAVTTTDVDPNGPRGRFVPVEPAGADRIAREGSAGGAEAHIAQLFEVGGQGSGFERGLEGAHLAFSGDLLLGHNTGFLRPDADLAVIWISDEEDSSSGSVALFADALRALRGSHRPLLTSAAAVVGDLPNGCQGAERVATAGARYLEAARQLLGHASSYCAAAGADEMAALGEVAFGARRALPLRGRPAPDTLQVSHGGVPLAGWSWAPVEHAVRLGPFGPPPGASVEVNYTPRCE